VPRERPPGQTGREKTAENPFRRAEQLFPFIALLHSECSARGRPAQWNAAKCTNSFPGDTAHTKSLSGDMPFAVLMHFIY